MSGTGAFVCGLTRWIPGQGSSFTCDFRAHSYHQLEQHRAQAEGHEPLALPEAEAEAAEEEDYTQRDFDASVEEIARRLQYPISLIRKVVQYVNCPPWDLLSDTDDELRSLIRLILERSPAEVSP